MSWTTIKKIFADCEQVLNETLEVRGWIRTQRQSKNFASIELAPSPAAGQPFELKAEHIEVIGMN